MLFLKNIKIKPILFTVLFLVLCCGGFLPAAAAPNGPEINITVLYDNYVHVPGTKADWGFSCLIEGTDKTILFDAGTNPEIFWHNINQLEIDINQIDVIVITHEHGDHYGGLFSFLEKRPGLPVYVPVSFTEPFVQQVKNSGGQVVKVAEPLELCRNVHLTGEMGTSIVEQSLVFDTPSGAAVLTGCAHPGIVSIVNQAGKMLDKDVYFVFGGFHLMEHSKAQIQEIIKSFASAGVKKCGATHCTGDQQIKWFKEAYGENYVPIGVGNIIKITL